MPRAERLPQPAGCAIDDGVVVRDYTVRRAPAPKRGPMTSSGCEAARDANGPMPRLIHPLDAVLSWGSPTGFDSADPRARR